MLRQKFQTVLFLLCILKISSEQIMHRIPLRQYAKYDSNNNLEWIPAIVGGVPASVGEFPSQVSVQTKKGRHLCGGTLIDIDYVLTAGHCVVDELGKVLQANTFQIMGDDLSITKNASATRQIRNAIHVFLHPSYNHFEAANDIAILKTHRFTETNTFKPASITFDPPKEGNVCQLAGWGTTNENSKKPNPVLFKATLRITNFEQCNASYAGQLKSHMFCAKGEKQDSCQGDSGGALLCNNLVSGVVSFGNGCDNPNFPGVYTDVHQYDTWIDEVLRTMVDDKEEQVQSENGDGSNAVKVASNLLLLSTTLVFKLFM